MGSAIYSTRSQTELFLLFREWSVADLVPLTSLPKTTKVQIVNVWSIGLKKPVSSLYPATFQT